jgi:signal transduction histidine kinase
VRWPPKLRTVLLTVSLVVFLIPLGTILVLRVYESELIRRTEAELISQGAILQAAYKRQLREELGKSGVRLSNYGKSVKVHWPRQVNQWLKPVPETLELTSDQIYPPLPPAKSTDQKPTKAAVRAGRAIRSILLDSQTITLSGTHVVDPEGLVVASTHSIIGDSLAHLEEIERALGGRFVQRLRRRDIEAEPPLASISRGTDFKVAVSMPIVDNGRLLGAVMLMRTPMNLKKALYRHRYPVGIALGLMLLGVIFIASVTSYFISQPIQRLIQQTRDIRNKEGGEAPIDSSRTAEFDELTEALADMATTIRERTDYIESFAQNVSHEFKSPLSSIQGTAEVLEEHWETMDEQKRQQFLANLKQDGQRLERLLNRLLALARADTHEPEDGAIDLGEQLEAVKSDFTSDSFEVEVSMPETAAIAAISREAFESVMSNLLTNAREHDADRVEIDVHTIADPEAVEIYVSDNGPGISGGNADKIFDSFFTTDQESGTGLGLSITQSLVEAHDGSIELIEREDGATFRIRLPRERLEGG